MPVDDIGVTGIIDDVDVDRGSLTQPQYRAWNGAVVARGLDRFARSEFERDRSDPDGMIDLRCRSLALSVPTTRDETGGARA